MRGRSTAGTMVGFEIQRNMAQPGLILPSGERRQPPRRPLSRRTRRVAASLTGKAINLDSAPPRKHRLPRHSAKLLRMGPSKKGWLIALILLSLLFHALIVLAFVFVGHRLPKFAKPTQPEKPPEVSLVLAQPPPHKPDFIPTQAQPNAPHVNQPLISDNDVALQSKNRVARDPNAPVPDVTGRKDHSFDLHTTPPSQEVKSNPSPPSPQSQQQPQQQKTAQQPNKATKPAETDPNAIHPTENPEKGDATVKVKPDDQQFDPNGLPVLPALSAPTIAAQSPTPIPSPRSPSPPPSVSSFAVYQSDIGGQAGAPGDNSPAAMATDLGRYKAKVYRAVGARWYDKVNSQIQVLGVGTVHVNYTIYSDGHMVITGDPDASNQALMLLHSISVLSMTEASPFDAFSDAMKKEVGDSFSDQFSFSIYGQ